MPTYTVTLPLLGSATAEVEAESEKQAIQRAIEEISKDIQRHLNELDVYKSATRGNVFNGPVDEAEVEEHEEEEEEEEDEE